MRLVLGKALWVLAPCTRRRLVPMAMAMTRMVISRCWLAVNLFEYAKSAPPAANQRCFAALLAC